MMVLCKLRLKFLWLLWSLLLSDSMAVFSFNDPKGTMIAALGKPVEVLESGILDVGKSFAGTAMEEAGFELYKMLPKVIKALVNETDPLVATVKEMKIGFEAVMNKICHSMQAESKKLKEAGQLDPILREIKNGGSDLVDNVKDMLYYNVTSIDLNSFGYGCKSSYWSPQKLLTIISEDLVTPCNKTLSSTNMQMFSDTMEFLTPFDLELHQKSKLAYMAMKSPNQHQKIVTLMENFRHLNKTLLQPIVDGLLINMNARCLFDLTFYGETCNRRNLLSVIAITYNSINEIAAGFLVCEILRFADNTSFINHIKDIYSELDELKLGLYKYYWRVLKTAPRMCDSAIVDHTVKHFHKHQAINPSLYESLGKKVLANLRTSNSPLVKRHIILAPSHLTYVAKCPRHQCHFKTYKEKELLLFFEYHNVSDYLIGATQQFLKKKMATINDTIATFHHNSIHDIIQSLKNNDAYLSGDDRCHKQVWLKQSQIWEPCTFPATMLYDSEISSSFHLFYEFPDFGVDHCMAYQIFIFP